MYYTGHLKLIKPNLLELGCDKIIPNISTNHLILNTELGFDKTFLKIQAAQKKFGQIMS